MHARFGLMSVGAEADRYKTTLVGAQTREEGRLPYPSRLTRTLAKRSIMSAQELYLVTGANGTQNIRSMTAPTRY